VTNVDVIARIEADVEDGGWKASGAVLGDADRLNFYQQIDVWFDLYAEGWEEFPRPGFIGHLLPDTWEKTFQSSNTPWSAFTAQEFMKRGRVQGIYFRHVDSAPANQHQIVNMTYADIVTHLVGQTAQFGHCNLRRGVWPEGIISLNADSANSSEIAEHEIKEGGFWDALKQIAEIDFYLLYVDKTNTLNFIPHPMFGTLPDPVLTLDSSLLLEPLRITRRNEEAIGQMRLQGQTPAGLQISGKYPTDPEPGPIVTRGGYMGTTNTLMNDIAERMYRFENRDYSIEAKCAGGMGLLLDLLDRVSVTYSSSVDGIAWSEKKFWVHKITVELAANFTAVTTLGLEAEFESLS
jgi:hypothetical protein